MAKKLSFLLLLLVLSAYSSSPPVFKINLDLPPEQRWKEVITAKKPQILSFLSFVESKSSSFGIWFAGKVLSMTSQYSDLKKAIQSAVEITGGNYNTFAFVNFIVQLEDMLCTAVLSLNSEGYVVHGRNFDYPLASLMKDMVLDLQFYRDGKLLYSGVGLAGDFGIFTGYNSGISLSLNGRPANSFTLYRNMWAMMAGYERNSDLIPRVLEQHTDYNDALNDVASTPIASPCYYALAGKSKYQGAVVTRSWSGTDDVWMVSDEAWFLVQTNYDHWEKTPDWDNNRVKSIQDYMEKVTRSNLTHEVMNQAMKTSQVFWRETVYSCVMKPASGEYSLEVKDD